MHDLNEYAFTAPTGMARIQLFTCLQAIEMHINSGGRVRLTRTATPTRIRDLFRQMFPIPGYWDGRPTMKGLAKKVDPIVRAIDDAHAGQPGYQLLAKPLDRLAGLDY